MTVSDAAPPGCRQHDAIYAGACEPLRKPNEARQQALKERKRGNAVTLYPLGLRRATRLCCEFLSRSRDFARFFHVHAAKVEIRQ